MSKVLFLRGTLPAIDELSNFLLAGLELPSFGGTDTVATAGVPAKIADFEKGVELGVYTGSITYAEDTGYVSLVNGAIVDKYDDDWEFKNLLNLSDEIFVATLVSVDEIAAS